MAVYVATCPTCKTAYDYIRKIADRHKTPTCCGAPTEMSLTAPAIGAMSFSSHKGFHIKGAGKGTWIESGSDYKKYMRDNDLIPASESAAEATLQKKNLMAEQDRKRREAVVKVVTERAP